MGCWLVGVDKSNVMMDSFIYSMIMINHRERKEVKLGDCVLIQIKRGIQNILYSCIFNTNIYQYQYAQNRLPTKKRETTCSPYLRILEDASRTLALSDPARL